MNSSYSYKNGATGTVGVGPTMVNLPPLPSATTSNTESGGSFVAASPSSSAPPPSPSYADNLIRNNNQHHHNNVNSTSMPPSPGVGVPDPQKSSPRLSSTWESDSHSNHCFACQSPFGPFKRRHHCRLCGRLFCEDCSNTRSLIPPSALVLKMANQSGNGGGYPSFQPSNDGDASVTYVSGNSDNNGDDDTLLYGRGLEQRILLARHPQRTCNPCREQLAPLQEELCLRNSNAMRYNYIDEGDAMRRLCNSPLAFTLGHEVRKAAYALGNLLPGSKGSKRAGFMPSSMNDGSLQYSYPPSEADPCHIPNGGSCKTIDPTLRNVDGMHIPANLLQRARGVAIVTSAKGGLGFAGFEFGTGLVVARRRPNGESGDVDDWSAPSAIGIASISWGALIGAQVSDHVFLLMTEDAVRLFSSEKGKSIQLGADVGVAVGPLGRSAEADIGATSGLSRGLDGGYGGSRRDGIAMAPIYTYSLSKGLYAGVSLDGRVLTTRDRVNEKFYGRAVTAHELLSGKVATPPAAQPLYDALKRCRVYGGGKGGGGNSREGVGGPSSSVDIGNSRIVDDYNVHDPSGMNNSSNGGGGFMERLSHTTGAGLPARSNNSLFSSTNPYNLSGRGDYD